jgi:hypothetical protein
LQSNSIPTTEIRLQLLDVTSPTKDATQSKITFTTIIINNSSNFTTTVLCAGCLPKSQNINRWTRMMKSVVVAIESLGLLNGMKENRKIYQFTA